MLCLLLLLVPSSRGNCAGRWSHSFATVVVGNTWSSHLCLTFLAHQWCLTNDWKSFVALGLVAQKCFCVWNSVISCYCSNIMLANLHHSICNTLRHYSCLPACPWFEVGLNGLLASTTCYIPGVNWLLHITHTHSNVALALIVDVQSIQRGKMAGRFTQDSKHYSVSAKPLVIWCLERVIANGLCLHLQLSEEKPV